MNQIRKNIKTSVSFSKKEIRSVVYTPSYTLIKKITNKRTLSKVKISKFE